MKEASEIHEWELGWLGKHGQIRDRRRFPVAGAPVPTAVRAARSPDTLRSGARGDARGSPPQPRVAGGRASAAGTAARRPLGERQTKELAARLTAAPSRRGSAPLVGPRFAAARSPPPLSTGRLRLQQEAGTPLRNRRWLRSSMGRRGGRAGAGCRGGEGERSRAPAARGCPAAEPQGDALQRGLLRAARASTRCWNAVRAGERGSLPLSLWHSTAGGHRRDAGLAARGRCVSIALGGHLLARSRRFPPGLSAGIYFLQRWHKHAACAKKQRKPLSSWQARISISQQRPFRHLHTVEIIVCKQFFAISV